MALTRFLFAAWLAFASLASFGAPDFTDQAALKQWMSRYYLKPEPALVGKAVLAARSHGWLIDDRAPLVFGFLAGVLNTDPKLARPLAAELRSLKGEAQSALLLGIWYSGHPETKALLKDIESAWPEQAQGINAMLLGKKVRLENISLEEGIWLTDALWGDFGGSGHEQPVIRLMSALGWIGPRASPAQVMVAGVTHKTLIEHAATHPRVMEICVAQARKQPAEIAGHLKSIIAAAKARQKQPGSPPG